MKLRALIHGATQLLAVCLINLACVQCCAADWLSKSGAEFAPSLVELWIDERRMRVVLRIAETELSAYEIASREAAVGAEFLARFDRKYWQFTSNAGEQPESKLISASRQSRRSALAPFDPAAVARAFPEREPIARGDDIVLELAYEFHSRPEWLIVRPPLDEFGFASGEFGIIVFHRQVPVIDIQPISGPERIILDGHNPWNSAFENRSFSRHHDAPLMSFLYVEPLAVRHEVLMRFTAARELIGVSLESASAAGQSPRNRLAPIALQFAKQIGAIYGLSADGAVVPGNLERAQLLHYNAAGLVELGDEELPAEAAIMVGLSWSHPVLQPVRRLEFEWRKFSDALRDIPLEIFAPGEQAQAAVTVENPRLSWHRLRPVVRAEALVVDSRADLPPLRSLGGLYLFGAAAAVACLLLLARARGRLSDRRIAAYRLTAAAAVLALLTAGVHAGPFGPLLWTNSKNFTEPELRLRLTALFREVYRAFDYQSEEQVYDQLARVVSGDLLEQVYLDHRRSLLVEQAGGAYARVAGVEVLTAVPLHPADSGTNLAVRASWLVHARVGHWGHTHERQNRYQAVLTLDPTGGQWKIKAFEVIEETRVL